MSHMHPSPVPASPVPASPAPEAAASVGGGRRRGFFKPTSLKPVTYSVMHLCVAVTVAYVLTRDWRIALGVGVIEPMVQTVAYMLHEKAWAIRAKPGEAGRIA